MALSNFDPDICEAEPLRMWITDLKTIAPHDEHGGYVFRNQLIRKADVYGLVTSYNASKEPTVLFQVDDGTDTIMCTANLRAMPYLRNARKMTSLDSEIHQKQNAGALDEEVAKALLLLLTSAKQSFATNAAFKVGDTVQVQGFISDCHGERRLNTFCIWRLSENLEVNRIHEMKSVYASLYNKPTECRLDKIMELFDI